MKLLLALLLAIPISHTFAQEKGAQIVVTLPEKIAKKTDWLNPDFLLFTPKTYSPTKKSPLLIFLHGKGERGDDIQRVKEHGPPKIVEQNPDFGFLLVSPQCTKDEKDKGWWDWRDLEALLAFLKANYPIDESRIYLTGLSMGGYGTWMWAAERPDTFAAIAPVCGGGDPRKGKSYLGLPIWAFHGDADPVVPVEKSTAMVDAINKAGGKAKITIYPGVGHRSWDAAYADPELYRWFLEHTR